MTKYVTKKKSTLLLSSFCHIIVLIYYKFLLNQLKLKEKLVF